MFAALNQDIFFKIFVKLYPCAALRLVCKNWNAQITKMHNNWTEVYRNYHPKKNEKPLLFQVEQTIEEYFPWIHTDNEEHIVLFVVLTGIKKDGALNELGKAVLYSLAGLHACCFHTEVLSFASVIEMSNEDLSKYGGIIFVTGNYFAFQTSGFLSVLESWYKKVYVDNSANPVRNAVVSTIVRSGIYMFVYNLLGSILEGGGSIINQSMMTAAARFGCTSLISDSWHDIYGFHCIKTDAMHAFRFGVIVAYSVYMKVLKCVFCI